MFGFARHMRDALPNASFIGFTGTPIETADANTRAVFGDYINVYDIQRAVEDQATVPASRLAKLELDEAAPRARPGWRRSSTTPCVRSSGAIVPEGVLDIFAAVGLTKPDISILSDEFLAEGDMPQRNSRSN